MILGASGVRVSVYVRECSFLSKIEEFHESRNGDVTCYRFLFRIVEGIGRGKEAKFGGG